MIFSADKWNKAEEINGFVKLSSGLSFDKMATPLNNAFRLFIVPLLGCDLVSRLLQIYASASEETEADFLSLCQRANANLALWYDFDEINTRITDSGFQRQETDNFKQAYKYQENNLRTNFRNKGFNALDEILAFLDHHIESFPEYLNAPAYVDGRHAIVRNTEEVNKVYFINGSRIIFLRLQTHFSFVEENVLRPALGDKLYEQLLVWIRQAPDDATARLRVEELRIKSGKVLIMNAVKRLMAETGSLTDRGLYFSSISSNSDGDESDRPVSDGRLSMQITQAEADAKSHMTNLMRFVKRVYPDQFSGNPLRVFDRDNDAKSTFWA